MKQSISMPTAFIAVASLALSVAGCSRKIHDGVVAISGEIADGAGQSYEEEIRGDDTVPRK